MSRQHVRVAVVAVSVVVLGVLGLLTASTDDESVAPGTPAAVRGEYAALVTDLHAVLAAYAPLQGVRSHDQVHLLGRELAGLEQALAQVEDAARGLGGAEAAELAELSAQVRDRAATVRVQAMADHTGLGGVATMQAFGRECALRAVSIGEALEGADDDLTEVAEAVAAVWPAPPEEGLGSSATRQ